MKTHWSGSSLPAAAVVPVVFGHRGCSADAPENTIAAFTLIQERGIGGVELDVHQCASGEIVVAHDHTLERTAGVPVDIRLTPWGELQHHDVGGWFGPAFAGERLPLLADVFSLLADSVLYDIEIKHEPRAVRRRHAHGTEREVIALISRHGLEDRCIISSFDPFALRRAERIAPEIPRAIIYAPDPLLPFFLRNGQGAGVGRATILKPREDVAAAALARAAGPTGPDTDNPAPVIPWTVDAPDRAGALVRAGVAGIISNRPHVVQAAL